MIQIREERLWRRVDGVPARVPETGRLELRGLDPAAHVEVGPLTLFADSAGELSLRLSEREELDCHVGMLKLAAGGWSGEIEVVPDKISEDAFRLLRGELESTWSGLLFDDRGATSIRARGPEATLLWRELGPALIAIRRAPLHRLQTITAEVRLDRVRRASELTPSVLLASGRGAPGRARVVAAVPADQEHGIVTDTLIRLQALARRQMGSESVEREVGRWLREPPFDGEPRHRSPHFLHSLRHDGRFRVVERVRRELQHPKAVMTEGPGELRLGVRGLNRLYEYWVFLELLRVAANELGPPETPGFEVLARRLHGGRLRLELPAGTTVRFPNGWSFAFEPAIYRSETGSWEDLEYVPHPSPELHRAWITPDICVLHRTPGSQPTLYVIDAKYRARGLIDSALMETHAAYSRVRWRRTGIVREVVVAHPHLSLNLSWAGCSAVTFRPGGPTPVFHWLRGPAPSRSAGVLLPTSTHPDARLPALVSSPRVSVADGIESSDRVLILLDQTWLRFHVGDRRIDLGALARRLASGRPFDAHLIAPSLPALESFFSAVTRVGWTVERTSIFRRDQITRAADICRSSRAPSVKLVSGSPDFLEAIRALREVEVIENVLGEPDL